mmetsp:Transcript_42894/g.41238  ORF Transcript_42894/g.41238 Transcript_42894/m.41238 type:complete len:101 (+) Transcript_42894:552-854(+)
MRWDLFIILLVIYNCLTIPYTLAFQTEESLGNTIFGYCMDGIFFFDILFNLRTTYINPKNGLEVFNTKKIALKYVIHWRFVTDVISIIPFELFYQLATES